MICNVVLVSQEHVPNAPHRFDPFHKGSSKPWRIDQNIAVASLDEITLGSIGIFRSKTAPVNLFVYFIWQSCDGWTDIYLGTTPNRTGGAGNERHSCLKMLPVGRRLFFDDGLIGSVSKNFRSYLPADRTIDTGGIYKEIS